MKVVIIEDDMMVRTAIVSFLSANGITVLLEVGDYEEFVNCFNQIPEPDIVLLDLFTHTKDNLSKISLIKNQLPNVKVIAFTSADSEETLIQAIKGGADSYYLKGGNPYRLLEAIKDANTGGFYITPQMGSKLVARLLDMEKDPKRILEHNIRHYELSHREVQIMYGLFDNKAYKETASEYNIGLNTVRYYVKSLYKKVGVKTRQELIKRMAEMLPEKKE